MCVCFFGGILEMQSILKNNDHHSPVTANTERINISITKFSLSSSSATTHSSCLTVFNPSEFFCLKCRLLMHTHFHFLNTASLGYSFTMCFPFFVGTMQIFLVLWLYFCITYSIMYHFQNQAFVLQWSLNILSLKLSFIHRFGILRSLLISSRLPF